MLRCVYVLAVASVGTGVAIHASQPEERSIADVVVRNISVLHPAASSWLTRQDIIVRDTKIASVAATGGALPKAKFTIDGTGKFAIPGLFDNHIHLARFTAETASLFIAYGVTSVRDMGTDPRRIVGWRRDIAHGKFMGPRIVRACGPMLEGRGEPRVDHWLVNSPDEAAGIVDRLADAGMDCVKVRTFRDLATYRAIGAAARVRGLMLTGHAPEPLDTVEAIAAGQRSFEHAFYPYPLSKKSAAERAALIDALVSSGAAHVPTLVAWRPATETMEQLRGRLDTLAAGAPFALPQELLAHWKNHLPTHQKEGRGSQGWRTAVETAAADIGALHRAGVLVLSGSDTGSPFVTPGLGLHDELSMLVTHSRLTPADALATATVRSAAFHRRADDLGSIEPGKIADLLLLTGDPLIDITQTRSIDAVIFRGETLTRAHLNRLLSSTRH